MSEKGASSATARTFERFVQPSLSEKPPVPRQLVIPTSALAGVVTDLHTAMA